MLFTAAMVSTVAMVAAASTHKLASQDTGHCHGEYTLSIAVGGAKPCSYCTVELIALRLALRVPFVVH